MKVKEVITRAMSGEINWMQAAEILGMYGSAAEAVAETVGEVRLRWICLTDGCKRPSPKRVALADLEQVLGLYREKYFDLNVKHFVEKLHEEHQIAAQLHLGEDGAANGRIG